MGRCVLVIVVGLVGCGRIGFDATAATDAGDVDAVADTPVLACAPLPCTGLAMIITCNGRCFATCSDLVSWSDGDLRCTAWGGRPAAIRESQDQTCLDTIASDVSWLGYRQGAGESATTTGWAWVDGTPAGFLRWGNNEPNDGDTVENNGEQCAQFNTDGTWADQNCAVLRAIACSRPAP